MNCDKCDQPMKALFTSMYCDCKDTVDVESSTPEEMWYGYGLSSRSAGDVRKGMWIVEKSLEDVRKRAITGPNTFIYRVRPLDPPKVRDPDNDFTCQEYEILEVVEGPGIP